MSLLFLLCVFFCLTSLPSVVSSNSDVRIEYWAFSFNSSSEFVAFTNDLDGLTGVTSCCEMGEYCFNVTQDYLPTEFSVFALQDQSEYVTSITPDYKFYDAHYQVTATYNMYNNKYTCYSPQMVDCQYNTWCTFPCSAGFNISSFVANSTHSFATQSSDIVVKQQPQQPLKQSKQLTTKRTPSFHINGISYWGLWVDADLLYSAFTNSLADTLACGSTGCNDGDYCFNVTNGAGVPTEFQVFAVFQNTTDMYYDVYDFAIRLSSSKYKLTIALTSNYTTTSCPLTASDGGVVSTCNYGDTCTATCPYNSVNIGFTLAQPNDLHHEFDEHD